MLKRLGTSLGTKIKSVPGSIKKKAAAFGSGMVAAAVEMDQNVTVALARKTPNRNSGGGNGGGGSGLGAISSNSSTSIVTNVIDTLETLSTYAGAFLLVIGLIMMFMGFKNEDAEGKHRAGLVIIAGIGLLSIKVIVQNVAGISGGTGTN